MRGGSLRAEHGISRRVCRRMPATTSRVRGPRLRRSALRATTSRTRAARRVCRPTPAASVANQGSATETQCAAGSYQPQRGTVVVPARRRRATTCANAGIHRTETPCAAGRYQPNAGSASCLPADAGNYVASQGSATEAQCAAGVTSRETGSTSCLPAGSRQQRRRRDWRLRRRAPQGTLPAEHAGSRRACRPRTATTWPVRGRRARLRARPGRRTRGRGTRPARRRPR